MEPNVIRGMYVPSGQGNPLHILTYRKGARWACNCLEYGLEGDGNDRGAAFSELKRLVGLLFSSPAGRGTGVPAPPRLWRLWCGAAQEIPAELHAGSPLPGREAARGRARARGFAA